MAIEYFDTFPRVDYDIGKDNKTREVIDILKRIGIRGDFKNLLPSYYKSVLAASERPEIVSYTNYGDIFSHWVLLHMNTITDPYHDWIMEESVMNEFIDLKYPDRNLLLSSTHHSDVKSTTGVVFPNTISDADYLFDGAGSANFLVVGETYTFYTVYGSDDFSNVGAEDDSPSAGDTFVATGTTPTAWDDSGSGSIVTHNVDVGGKRFFVKGETIKEYKPSGNIGPTDVTGTISDFDATLIQFTYKATNGSFVSDNYVKGDDSGAVGKIAGVTTERVGVHHYESADGIEVGRSHSGASAITNETFEFNENEKKREIMMLDAGYIQQFEQNFEDLMNA